MRDALATEGELHCAKRQKLNRRNNMPQVHMPAAALSQSVPPKRPDDHRTGKGETHLWEPQGCAEIPLPMARLRLVAQFREICRHISARLLHGQWRDIVSTVGNQP
jgi:hypothetical protein